MRYYLGMRCEHCGADNAAAARFCSACGEMMLLQPERGEREEAAAGPRVLVMTCHHCGEMLEPDSYFSRGVNVAKLVALLPINFVLPVLFFFLRKDRLVCGNCRKLLPDQAPTALLTAMPGGEASRALVPFNETGLTLTTPEAQQLELAGQRAKGRGVWMGIMAVPFSLPLVMALTSLGWVEAAMFGLPGAIAVTGAVGSFRRAGVLVRRAREVEGKHLRRRVMSLARKHQGRLTVAGVATALGYDFAEAEQILDKLVDGRHVDVEVTEQGRLVYVFPDLVD